MLIPAVRLLRRVRQVPSRADELITLVGRFRAEDPATAGAEERAIALEMRALKMTISSALTRVSSCSSCATGVRRPHTAFSGGDCCGGVTADLFSDDEVAALAISGTRPRHLRAPRSEHGGCAFRGVTGCTLSAAHRPQRCVHYVCNILRRELRGRGDLDSIDMLLEQLKQLMLRFVALRGTRLDDELFSTLEDALVLARRSPSDDARRPPRASPS